MDLLEVVRLHAMDNWRLLLPIGVVGALSWSVWGVRKFLSALYRPTVNDFRTSTSVVVPSFHEDPDILDACLETWLAENPTEVVVVLGVDDTESRHRLVARQDPRLHVIVSPHEEKRAKLGVGIRAAIGEVVVLTDSDTRWKPGLLVAVQMPFADPQVGGVGTQQNVYQANSSIWRRVADWIIDSRYFDYVPATGRAGGVVCLSGRTAAYRRATVLPLLPHLENEFFLGRRCISGDDGRLTWLVLASGSKTVHQSSAEALSMFPATFGGFCRQRVRWSRNSYRCYLTALWKGWIWRVSPISQLTVYQILLTPLTMAAALYYIVTAGFRPQAGLVLGLTLLWLFLGRALRSTAHLRRRPTDLLLLPLVTLVIMLVALPIKTYAFFTMNKQGWITRRADLVGGEGQGADSLPAERTVTRQLPKARPAPTPWPRRAARTTAADALQTAPMVHVRVEP
jgi:cellulose synthase/poly-beta-1,6-N-acetylglucosamine synthase-like glycosyltransferase